MLPAFLATSSSFKAPRVLACTACCFVTGTLVSATLFRARVQRSPTLHQQQRHRVASAMSVTQVAGGEGRVIPAPSGKADSTVIFLHGLGDTADGWAGAFPLDGLPNTKYILPTADTIPVSLNMGFRMPSWFDLYGLDPDSAEDREGILKAAERVSAIIEGEIRAGIPRDRIIVGGFSQGGALALTIGMRTPEKLAGVVAMSTWLPLRNTFQKDVSEHAKATQVLMCAGQVDNVVNPQYGASSAKLMRDEGVDVNFKSYAGLAHGANAEELQDVADYMKKALDC